MLRRSTVAYNNLWVEHSRKEFENEPKAEMITQHLSYWDTLVEAVDANEYSELMKLAQSTGGYLHKLGIDIAEAIQRTVEATNTIEIALLEANSDEVSATEIITEVADLRSMIVMAVVEGFREASSIADAKPKPRERSGERLRALLTRNEDMYPTVDLRPGDEIGPPYDQELRFYAVKSGKLRLYNLLPNGRTITISILSEGDVFLQWRTESTSLSCICAEAMQASRVITASQKQLVDLLAAQPAAAVDLIANFARRLTESQALIEDLMNNSVDLRLYRTLLDLAREFGNGNGNGGSIVIGVPLTHQRLADMIGSNRVTITRKLHELQKREIVAARGTRSIEILDPEALRRLTRLESE
jgi:CRP/FNR family cyclic AMP-dependent transcriptional regulator